MSEPEPRWEQAVDVVETGGALLACAFLASCPVWGAVLLSALFGVSGLIAFPVLLVAFVIAPALPVGRDRRLDGYQRWGTNMGRLLRAPITLATNRRKARETRSLGASTSASSTAAPSSPRDR